MKKKIMVIVIILLIIGLLGISYSIFNYTRVGDENTFIVGDIYMSLTEGNEEVALLNILPESAEEARTRNDNYLTFTIDGKNESDKDVYYEILLKYGEDKASPYERFLDKDLLFDLVELNQDGTEKEYLISGMSYQNFNNKRIWVDTISHNTNDDIERKYKLRVWLSEGVVISDTLETANYKATGEHAYKNHYANVKVAVYGDFIEKDLHSLYQVVKNDVARGYAVKYTDETRDTIDGRGAQDVYYYKGKVRDTDENSDTYEETMNNVIFANFCWQMVRTTDTGGVKVIYNGRPVDGKCENVQFDSSGNQIKSGRDNQAGIKSASPASNNLSGGTYYYGTNYEANYEDQTFKLSGTVSNDIQWSEANKDSLIGKYTCKSTDANATCATLYYVDDYVSNTNAYVVPLTINSTHYSVIGTSGFNASTQSLAYVGYMYNTVYGRNRRNVTNYPVDGSVFANSFKYENGQYFLNLDVSDDNKKTITDWSTEYNTINNTHYTCFNTTGECGDSVYYVYYASSTIANYIKLTNGKSIEDALNEMLYNDDVNQKDSTIKHYLESWYQNNLLNYADYIEDVIYCNDRSFSGENGWNPNGGAVNNELVFNNFNARYQLICNNSTDSFSVTNTKAKLKYPISLLTADEFLLARVSQRYAAYLYSTSQRVLSPVRMNSFNGYGAVVGYVTGWSIQTTYGVDHVYGVRPVISLKFTDEFSSGDGSESNPYVVLS